MIDHVVLQQLIFINRLIFDIQYMVI